MLSVAQNYRSGEITLEEAAVPALQAGGILVQTAYSLVSSGTESMKVREAKLGYFGKARARPDQMRQVLDSLRQQGFRTTMQKIINRLDRLTPLGYALSGRVIAVGEDVRNFKVGDRVACAGAGYATHAEVNFIPQHLAVKIPENVTPEHAAFTTIGALAIHALRQSELQLGETAVVFGLGLVGQMLVRVLNAAGIRVVGLDPDTSRHEAALKGGVILAASPVKDLKSEIHALTGGQGADAVFLAAPSQSNEMVQQASRLVRSRGRMVVVGKAKMDLPYDTFFGKEIDVRYCRSYGPGRYDSTYEEEGRDYPYDYVRWTENRNMQAFVNLLHQGRVDVSPLIGQVIPFAKAAEFYEEMNAGKTSGIGYLFQYERAARPPEKLKLRAAIDKGAGQPLTWAVIGAGHYAGSMLLPELKRNRELTLDTVVTRSALSAADAARKYGFQHQTCDVNDIWKRKSIGAVLIVTPHNTHASLAATALKKGRHVLMEKPVALDAESLENVRNAYLKSGRELFVNLNRRFSPVITKMKSLMAETPHHYTYRIHAGAPGQMRVAPDSQGSRFVGEAMHFIDVIQFLSGAHVEQIFARQLEGDKESMIASLKLTDGSTAEIIYLTQGGEKTPKEVLEIMGGGQTLIMENFRSLTHITRHRKRWSFRPDKGQRDMLKTYIACMHHKHPAPIDFATLYNNNRAVLAAEESLRLGLPVNLA